MTTEAREEVVNTRGKPGEELHIGMSVAEDVMEAQEFED
jgi:hypothetical protein